MTRSFNTRRYSVCALLAYTMLSPLTAAAHLVNTGFGSVYDGIGHFFYSLEEFLLLVLLVFLAGLNGTKAARSAVFVVPCAWAAGAVAGLLFDSNISTSSAGWPLATGMLILGAGVALDRALALPVLHGILALVGFGVGAVSGSGLSRLPDAWLLLAGNLLAQWVTLTWLSAIVVFAVGRAAWLRIGVRVAGSWIAATGILLLGWQFRA